MKLATTICLLLVSAVTAHLLAQGRGWMNEMGQAEVLKVASGLTNGMRASEARKYLADRGLEADMSKVDRDLVETIYYMFNYRWTNRAYLVLQAKAKAGMTYGVWKSQGFTNSFLFSAEIQSNGVKIGSITLTNAP
jgi:hypothetical protein